MINSIEVKNFKAIKKARVKLTPLTAFIGYNGSGKSSVLEALETYKIIVTEGLDAGMLPFRGFEHIHYKGKTTQKWYKKAGIRSLYSSIKFGLKLSLPNFLERQYKAQISTSVAQEYDGNQNIFFIEESYKGESVENSLGESAGLKFTTESDYRTPDTRNYDLRYAGNMASGPHMLDRSMISNIHLIKDYFENWQFLSMNTFLMGAPTSQKRAGGKIILNKDGNNIAEYLLALRKTYPEIFDGIIETIQYVLPYAKDIQPEITSELERMVYLQLSEQDFKVPGWLLSTGTLKILALLAVFRNPRPAPLVVIEEIENGLDPRTINLIVSEIRELVKDKKSQVIITTHSPYLLDLLHLSQVVFVERKDGNVVFNRPYDFEQLRSWSKEYTPGEMYRKDLIQQIIK